MEAAVGFESEKLERRILLGKETLSLGDDGGHEVRKRKAEKSRKERRGE